mmetsp:Transcript_4548/g.8765  ORF Transcript_4548/g.8765 Transcript_4548/m.8765 type:complete len:271 (-) Transcript_4548:28-840(-)
MYSTRPLPVGEEDEYHVDAQGFLLNAEDDMKFFICKGEDEVNKNNDNPEPVLGYDLSPFQPNDDEIFFFEKKKDECCFTVDTMAPGREEKVQEGSLLQKGDTEEQLARIEMYNVREVDSDSEEEEEEEEEREEKYKVDHQDEDPNNTMEEELQEEDNVYISLQQDEEEYEGDQVTSTSKEDDEEECANDNVSSSNLPSKQMDLLETPKLDQFNKADERVEISENTVAETGTVEKNSSKSPFTAVVPLLKPPPKEKLEAYLSSKKGWNTKI